MKNSQFKVENRRNWKGQVVDYDKIKAYEHHECLYCLTDAQVAVLGGVIEFLAWATRWQSDTQDIDEIWTREFRDDIQRRLMMSCCGDTILYRYDENGDLQQSEDGGVTYTPAPQADIRINPNVIMPPIVPIEGTDTKCIAADGMITLLKEQVVDQLTDGMSRYTLNQLINDFTTTLIGTSDPFRALANVITNQVFALIIASVRAAINSGTYDTLNCIFYSHMDETGFFSGAGWELVRSDILSQISGIAGVFFEHLVYLMGNGGLSNLARAGAGIGTADCSGCGSTTCSLDAWNVQAGIGVINTGTRTSSFVEIDASLEGDGHYYVVFTSNGDNVCCDFNSTGDASGSIYVSSGVANISKYLGCGSDHTRVIEDGVPLAFGTASMNAIEFGGTGPFTLVVRTDQ